MREINEDREVVKLVSVKGQQVEELDLTTRRRHFRDISRQILDVLQTTTLIDVVTALAHRHTQGRFKHAPAVVEDIVGAYETGAQSFVESETKNVENFVNKITAEANNGESEILPPVEQLSGIITNWNYALRRIQILSIANGTRLGLSSTIAGLVRGLSVYLYNEHNMIEAPARITDILSRQFSFLETFSERFAEDQTHLVAAKQAREQATKNRAEFNRDITYSAMSEQFLRRNLASPQTASDGRGRQSSWRRLIESVGEQTIIRLTALGMGLRQSRSD
jgi:hypothetical protein